MTFQAFDFFKVIESFILHEPLLGSNLMKVRQVHCSLLFVLIHSPVYTTYISSRTCDFLKPTVHLDIFQHLNKIEEQVLESLAWTTVSEIKAGQAVFFFFFFSRKNVIVRTTI